MRLSTVAGAMATMRRFGVYCLSLSLFLAAGTLCGQGFVVRGDRNGDQGEEHSEYALPQVPEVDLQSYEDFRRHLKESNWSRAFRSISSQLESTPVGCLPAQRGMALSWRLRILRDLSELPAAGRRAFRLFYDAKARKLMARAEELESKKGYRPQLETVFYSYFPTTSGDDAAWALALLEFRAGKPKRAIYFIDALLEHHPDSDLELIEVAAVRTAALAEGSRDEDFAEAAEDFLDRYEGEEVEFDGKSLTVEALVEELKQKRLRRRAEAPSLPDIGQEEAPDALWRDVYVPPAVATRNAWRQNFLPDVPDLQVEGNRVYVNASGALKAYDLESSEPLWAAGRTFPNDMGSMNGRCFCVAAGDRVLYTSPPRLSLSLKRQNQVRMKCLDAANGDTIWSTRSLKPLRDLSLAGRPLVRDGLVYFLAHPTTIARLELVVVKLEDGSVVARHEIGTPVRSQQGYFWGMQRGASVLRGLTPHLVIRNDEAYVLTDGGAVLALNWRSGQILWAYAYSVTRQNQRFSPASYIESDGVLYFRAGGSRRLVAIDLEAGTTLFERPCKPEDAIIGLDSDRIYLQGPKGMSAFDRESLDPLWANPVLKRSAGQHSSVIAEDEVIVVERLGITFVDKQTGDVKMTWPKIFEKPKPKPKPAPIIPPKSGEVSNEGKAEEAQGDKAMEALLEKAIADALAKEKAKQKAKPQRRKRVARRKNARRENEGGNVIVVGDRLIAVSLKGIVALPLQRDDRVEGPAEGSEAK